ncbi:hypothetical protein EV126DRAFT_79876 [Verticillium dahliae]|nr:hypothetical protein EV126DRAFT_79876 [Verticillium dahliae]
MGAPSTYARTFRVARASTWATSMGQFKSVSADRLGAWPKKYSDNAPISWTSAQPRRHMADPAAVLAFPTFRLLGAIGWITVGNLWLQTLSTQAERQVPGSRSSDAVNLLLRYLLLVIPCISCSQQLDGSNSCMTFSRLGAHINVPHYCRSLNEFRHGLRLPREAHVEQNMVGGSDRLRMTKDFLDALPWFVPGS